MIPIRDGDSETAAPRWSERSTRITSIALATITGLLTTVHLFYYFPRVVDDLFISLRYAENFAHGRGLVFNVGERIEGFSNPLWTLVQSVGLVLRIEGVLWTKLLGAASLAGLHVGAHRFSREVLGIRDPLALLPNLFLASNSYVVAWSTLGLETPLHLALILWSFVLVRRAAAPTASQGARGVAIASAVCLSASRPEGVAWAMLAVGCAWIVAPLTPRELLAQAKVLARVALPAAGIVVALLLARRVYYEDWVPNTYYVKSADAGIDLKKLQALWTHGAAPIESVVLCGGPLLLAIAAVRRERLAGVAIALLAAAFTAAVELDWMPSLRHELPLVVVAPMGFAWVADVALARPVPSRGARVVAIGLATAACVVTLAAAIVLARLDARNVIGPFGDGRWTKMKTMVQWSDTILSLKRREPPHVAKMHVFHMGMITQNYRAIEGSAAPLESSWYLGRDIGKVAYYTDMNIFDTAGLVTGDVVEDPVWRGTRRPSEELVARALAKHPVSIEWFGWGFVAAKDPTLERDYQLVGGPPKDPIDLDARTAGPDPEEILRRYQRFAAKFPQAFYLETLYGESVGAAWDRRTRVVAAIVDDVRAMPDEPPPDATTQGAMLEDGAVVVRGCAVAPPKLRPGQEGVLRCWFDVRHASRKPWTVFAYFEENGIPRFGADHMPVAGLSPSWKWRDGQRIKDAARFTVPLGMKPGLYGSRLGLFWGPKRANAAGLFSEKGERLIGPMVEVMP